MNISNNTQLNNVQDDNNPYKGIFDFKDDVSESDLYDAITLRFGRAKALMFVGGSEETEIWNFKKDYIVNYFATVEALVEELSYLVEKLYFKMV